jgi:molecular chaperone GrpE
MIDPKGPNPEERRHPDSKEPHFEQRNVNRPMYATDPESTSPGDAKDPSGPAGNPFRGWKGPGHAAPDRPAQAAGAQGEPGPAKGAQGSDGNAPGDGAGTNAATGGQSTGNASAEYPSSGGQWSGSWATGGDGAGSGSAGAGQDEPEAHSELRAALAAAQAAAKESHEQYLRALADMENVRRRAQEDVSKAHKFAIEAFAESMLPVRDSLEMALTVEVPSVESLREGVEATLRQLVNAFERNRVVVIDPLHQKFDPHLHQAISMAPSKNVAPNHVVAVLQKGYMINERILRPALVTVSQSS